MSDIPADEFVATEAEGEGDAQAVVPAYAYAAAPDPGVLPLDLEMLEEEQGTEGAGEVPPPETEEGE